MSAENSDLSFSWISREAPGRKFLLFIVAVNLILALVSLAFGIPFFISEPIDLFLMNKNLQGFIFALTIALLFHAWLMLQMRNALLLLFVSFVISYGAELFGIHHGATINLAYHYHPAITPRLPGDLPICIPLSWFMLSYTAVVFMNRFPLRNAEKFSFSRVFLKSVLCGLYVLGFDFVLDPLAVKYKFWIWQGSADFFGIPYGNFIAWFLIGFIICFFSFLIQAREKKIAYHGFDSFFKYFSVFFTIVSYAGCLIVLKNAIPVLLSMAIMGPAWIFSFGIFENYNFLKFKRLT